MNKTLVAAFASLFCTFAVGCVEDEPSVDPAIIETIERDSGFEVILVEGAPRPDIEIGGAQDAVLDGTGVGYAPPPRPEHVGGADLVRDNRVGSDPATLIPMQELDTSGTLIPMQELDSSGTLIPMEELDSSGTLIPMEELPTTSDGSTPDDPCDCAGEDCRREWVEVNLGCDVCAVFVCGDEVVPHACNACP